MFETVKAPPEALVVSKPMFEPAAKPLALVPFAPPRLVKRVVTWAVVNSLVPPTLKASVPPLAALMLAAVQLAGVLL